MAKATTFYSDDKNAEIKVPGVGLIKFRNGVCVASGAKAKWLRDEGYSTTAPEKPAPPEPAPEPDPPADADK